VSLPGDALLLRDWAARALFTSHRSVPPTVSEDAWRFFLIMEYCALLLKRCCTTQLPPVVDIAAESEANRVASARIQIARLGEIAAQEKLKVVLVKGGVAVIAGADMHLEDVDVLCSRADAHVLARHFDGTWAAGSFTTTTDAAGLRIEVHPSKPALLDAAVPSRNAPGLLELAPREHLWYVLNHSVRHHPDRIARLRDIALIRHVLEGCSEEDVRHVMERARQTEESASLVAVLAFAHDRDMRGLATVDRFVRTRYFMIARFGGLGRSTTGRTVLNYAGWLTATPWKPSIRRAFVPIPLASRIRGLDVLYERAPHLDRVIRLGSRPFVLGVSATLVLIARAEARLRSTPTHRPSHAKAATPAQP
jgi:hypothetical protein